jgi:hypothetical protein
MVTSLHKVPTAAAAAAAGRRAHNSAPPPAITSSSRTQGCPTCPPGSPPSSTTLTPGTPSLHPLMLHTRGEWVPYVSHWVQDHKGQSTWGQSLGPCAVLHLRWLLPVGSRLVLCAGLMGCTTHQPTCQASYTDLWLSCRHVGTAPQWLVSL